MTKHIKVGTEFNWDDDWYSDDDLEDMEEECTKCNESFTPENPEQSVCDDCFEEKINDES